MTSRAVELLTTGKLNVDNQNKAWRDDTSGFGFKMMQKMGWKKGKGLGKDETGINQHLKAGRRVVGLGLGASAVENNNTPWLETTNNFASLLSQLQSAGHATAQAGRAALDDSSSDEDVAAQERKAKKRKKSGAKAIYKPTKRLKAKDVSQYSAEDLATILGLAPSAAASSASSSASSSAPAAAAAAMPALSEKKELKKQAKKAKKAKKAAASAAAAATTDAASPTKKKKTKKKKKKKTK